MELKFRDVVSKIRASQGKDKRCFSLCLKIVSQLIRRQQTLQEESVHDEAGSQSGAGANPRYQISRDTVTLYVTCMESVGRCLARLSEADKEFYFSEVKNLIKIIKQEQRRHLKER